MENKTTVEFALWHYPNPCKKGNYCTSIVNSSEANYIKFTTANNMLGVLYIGSEEFINNLREKLNTVSNGIHVPSNWMHL